MKKYELASIELKTEEDYKFVCLQSVLIPLKIRSEVANIGTQYREMNELM